MNTATNKTQQAKVDSIPGWTPARVAVAILVVVVAVVGMWGAVSAVQGVRAYQETKRLGQALEQARYALSSERSAIRAPEAARGRSELRAAAATFSSQLEQVRDAGEATLAAALQEQQAQLLRSANQVFAARSSGNGAATAALVRNGFEPGVARLDSELAGALTGVRDRSSDSWPSEPSQRLELAAGALLAALGLVGCAMFLMRLVGYRRRLERMRREKLSALEEAALSDNLTGLGNHRAFYDDLKGEITRRARTGSHFSLVMLDLDGLKEINDNLGHQAGDERIKGVAECLRATLRNGGAYRTGGDEFMVLLPDERAWGALTYTQRLQGEISRHRKVIGISSGIVESSDLESAETLVQRADIALYDAKRTGRQVVIYSDGLRAKPTDRHEDVLTRRHHRLLATALAQAVDAKDRGTRNHSDTVSALCVLIGQTMGLGSDHVEQLRLAGMLHDVGKIGIADALLLKPDGLDGDEWKAMTGHVQMGHAIVAAAGLEEEANWILHHHERMDGKGYPDGLIGPAIPLESRIILVADAFEAMTSERPYRAAREPADAFAELQRGADTQFDPRCVEALRSALGSELGAEVLELPTPITQLAARA